jgi:opacity protein-like surface antigen
MKKKIVLALLAMALLAGASVADHAWSTYHWARTTSSFNLTVVNSTTAEWDGHVAQAIADWSDSSVLNMVEDPSGDTSSKTRRQCSAPSGQVRICNLAYGNNGWLGIAGISIDSNGHIVSGYTKLNDTYFSSSYAGGYYDNFEWRQSVTCQELGHNVGLGHQDENFNNQSLFSCMDYQDPPYEYPNLHDYQQLEAIYDHLDSYDSYATSGGGDGGGGGGGCNSPPGKGCNKGTVGNHGDIGWGMSLGRRGQVETFIRIDPDGTRHVTHVTWVHGH